VTATAAATAASAAENPDRGGSDGLQDKFHYATLTFQRSRQLKNGARPRVEAGDHKLTRVALMEVMAGMVSWDLTDKPSPPWR
jgi:DNA-directed RNA polymerase subunit K/omega